LVERPLNEVRCLELPHPSAHPALAVVAEIPPLNPADFPDVPIPDYQQGIVILESLPKAKAVIYLDFGGGYTESWGGVAYAPSNYGKEGIRAIWERVAEDYFPFTINVTTDRGVYDQASRNSRQRVIITPTDTAEPGAGGASYVGSFNSTTEVPCWVFITNGASYCAQACSHEAGHALGLVHNGQYINGVHYEYYWGQGTGDMSWAPIMGVGYYKNVTQWSKGEYPYADSLQNQIAVISSQNNVTYRAPYRGSSLGSVRYLEIYEAARLAERA
jgi:hypothetical protein